MPLDRMFVPGVILPGDRRSDFSRLAREGGGEVGRFEPVRVEPLSDVWRLLTRYAVAAERGVLVGAWATGAGDRGFTVEALSASCPAETALRVAAGLDRLVRPGVARPDLPQGGAVPRS